MNTYSEVLLSAQATDETAAAVADVGLVPRFLEHTFHIDWGTGVTAGVVTIEAASSRTYAGTWAPLQVVTFAGTPPRSDVVNVTGAFMTLRARISTAVADGTVTVTYVGSGGA